MNVHVESLSHAAYLAIQHVVATGNESAPRGMKIIETLGFQMRISDPTDILFELVGRDLKHKIGIMEGLQLIAQTSMPGVVTESVAAFEQFTNGGVFDGAYGVRAHGQIRHVVNKLRGDQDSRQAVITIFDGHRDLPNVTNDVPCTLNLQFMIREGKLVMIVTMRSNDVWLGLPYDLMQFAMLQSAIATVLDVPVGEYIHQVGSLHLYESNRAGAMKILAEHDPSVVKNYRYERPWSATSLDELVRNAEKLLIYRSSIRDASAFELLAAAMLR